MRRCAAVVVGALLVVAVQSGQATVPRTLSYQGALQDGAGNPVPDGDYSLSFRIYDLVSGGTALWTESQTVTVEGGIFNAVLGSTTPLTLPFDEDYWLGISVAAEAELVPRVELTAAPYALRAATADVGELTLPYHATTASSEILFRITNNGTGGAGRFENTGSSTTPALYCQSGSGGEAVRAYHASGNNAQLGTSNAAVNGNSGTNIGVRGYATGSARGVLGVNATAGNFAYLGTPDYAVYGHAAESCLAGYFEGSVQMTGFKLTTGASAGKVLTSDASGAGTWQTPAAMPDADWTIAGSDMYSAVSGNVGIGLPNPNRKLYVSQGLTGLAYPLKLDNTDATIGTCATGILFSVGGSGVERGKGALVYRCEDTWNRGSFYFLQDRGANTDIATMSDAVMTITNDGKVGVGLTSPPSARLEVGGEIRASNYYTGTGVFGRGGSQGVVGVCNGSSAQGHLGTHLDGIFGETDEATGSGVWAQHLGEHGTGVTGLGGTGVLGYGGIRGVYGLGPDGVVGDTNGNPGDHAGHFYGNVAVHGIIEYGFARTLTDHPLDPYNKVLQSAPVEASEQLMLYRGSATLDDNGEAVAALPSYFTALVDETEATVNLTPVGRSHAAQRYEFSYEWDTTLDRFRIYGEPGREVAWLVLAERDDPSARANPVQVEMEKGEGTCCPRGQLLDPVAYGRPPLKHPVVDWGPRVRDRMGR